MMLNLFGNKSIKNHRSACFFIQNTHDWRASTWELLYLLVVVGCWKVIVIFVFVIVLIWVSDSQSSIEAYIDESDPSYVWFFRLGCPWSRGASYGRRNMAWPMSVFHLTRVRQNTKAKTKMRESRIKMRATKGGVIKAIRSTEYGLTYVCLPSH